MKRISNKSVFMALPLLMIFIFQMSPISGQEASTDSITVESIKDLSALADKDKVNAQIWWYGWLAGYSAATAGQGIVFFTSDNKATRQDMAVGAATTFLGAMGQLLTPMVRRDASYGNPDVRGSFTGGQPLSSEQSMELLKALALREKEGRSWKVHAMAGVVNIGSGLITWIGFKRTFRDGLENFALNTVITEAQIWTQPTRAIRDYRKYCRQNCNGEVIGVLEPESGWTVNVYPGGFAIRLDF
ncbi:MAG TPA: hypothetical protein VMV74_08335 [Bacteroidales bacterium]|nr:hypothetical protein [Bacteroidales bacterium]